MALRKKTNSSLMFVENSGEEESAVIFLLVLYDRLLGVVGKPESFHKCDVLSGSVCWRPKGGKLLGGMWIAFVVDKNGQL